MLKENISRQPEQHLEAPSFEVHRRMVDNRTREVTGEDPMPRVGVYYEADYEKILQDPGTIFDEQGRPVVCRYEAAYPHFNKDKFPWLAEAGYFLLPAEDLSNALERIKDSQYVNVIAELVSEGVFYTDNPGSIDFGQFPSLLAHKINEKFSSKVEALNETIDYGSLQLLEGDGQPIIHHLIEVVPGENEGFPDDPACIDTYEDPDFILSRVDQISDMYIEGFSEHSKSATVVELATEETVRDSIQNPNWYTVVHVNEEKKVDGVLYATTHPEETPWIDPNSVTYDDATTVSIDGVAVAKEARGSWISGLLGLKGCKSLMKRSIEKGKPKLMYVFDTAGHSTESIPHIVTSATEAAGLKAKSYRVDALVTACFAIDH
jgi:hypothetical protein